MSSDWFAAGKTGNRLVDNSLKNRSRQIFSGSTVVDQWLNIRFGKYTTARCDGVKRLVIFGILVKTGRIRLK